MPRRHAVHPAAASLAAPMVGLPQPGPLLVALDLHLYGRERERALRSERLFDRASLAVAENSDGCALFATDFQADAAGFVRILVHRPQARAASAPVRWCSALSNSRPTAHWRCSACRRRSG